MNVNPDFWPLRLWQGDEMQGISSPCQSEEAHAEDLGTVIAPQARQLTHRLNFVECTLSDWDSLAFS